MGLFSDCLFGCDIDGTLLANGVINPHNIEKIEYFISEGGAVADFIDYLTEIKSDRV